jgi:hypothetical protein
MLSRLGVECLGKLGRKVCCNFNNTQKCIILVNGNKMCVFDETSEEQEESGDLQFGICPLLPEHEREAVMEAMKTEGFGIKKRWKG